MRRRTKILLILGTIIGLFAIVVIVLFSTPQIGRLVERYQFYRYQRNLTSVLIKEESIPIYDLDYAIVSGKIEIFEEDASIRYGMIACAIVKEISDNNLTILDLTWGMGKAFYLMVTVSQSAEINFRYVVPEGAPEEKVTGSIGVSGVDWLGRTKEEEFKTGHREISFEDIKVGDFISIGLYLNPDDTIKEISIEVMAEDLANKVYGL